MLISSFRVSGSEPKDWGVVCVENTQRGSMVAMLNPLFGELRVQPLKMVRQLPEGFRCQRYKPVE